MDINTSTVRALHLGDAGCAAFSCKVRVRKSPPHVPTPSAPSAPQGWGRNCSRGTRRCSRVYRGGEFLTGFSYQNQDDTYAETSSS